MDQQEIKAIIIDDEERARNSLATLLREFCPDVTVLAMAANVPEGVLQINKLRPDLVFLDIEMPDYNGFELLGFFREVDFEFIFVTAYNEYALRAFEVAAVDYLLKPVEIGLLQAAVDKARKRRFANTMQQRIEVLKEAFGGDELRRIALSLSDGMVFVEVADIELLEADGAYTKVVQRDGTSILVSKKLKVFEDLLLHRINFARPHRSYIVNLNRIRRYNRGESLLLMDNGTSIPIARDKKQEFDALLKDRKIAL
ncbi:MAG: LytTR family DNA-binding domain-containing protein [Bacteroidia bacterium]